MIFGDTGTQLLRSVVLLLVELVVGIELTSVGLAETGGRSAETDAVIREMDALDKELPFPVQKLDEIMARLQAAPSARVDMAALNYHAAYLIWGSGGQQYDSAIRYAREALNLPQGLSEQTHLHIILGDLLLRGRARTTPQYWNCLRPTAA